MFDTTQENHQFDDKSSSAANYVECPIDSSPDRLITNNISCTGLPRFIVLDFSSVNYVDTTAADVILNVSLCLVLLLSTS